MHCPARDRVAQVKERPVVHYVDLPVYGTPMSLAWRKHRMRCVDTGCTKKSWVLEDHRIAAKNCLLTTRAAKWGTVQVGGGRTVSEVAAELTCDGHTINDAVTTYGAALLAADRKRLNRTSAIGLDETSFLRSGEYGHTSFVTMVADVENHQIIDILPTRKYTDVAGWIDQQSEAWKERIRFGALDMSATYAAVYSVMLPKARQVVDPSISSPWPTAASTPSAAGSRPNRPGIGGVETIPSIGPVGCSSWARRSSMPRPPTGWPPSSN